VGFSPLAQVKVELGKEPAHAYSSTEREIMVGTPYQLPLPPQRKEE